MGFLLVVLTGIILVVVSIIFSFCNENRDLLVISFFVVGMMSIICSLGSLGALRQPSGVAARKQECEICIAAYGRGELSDEETTKLVEKIALVNDDIEWIERNQRGFYYGIFVNNDKVVPEIAMEPWMEKVRAHIILGEE